jgi:hypothetical protein
MNGSLSQRPDFGASPYLIRPAVPFAFCQLMLVAIPPSFSGKRHRPHVWADLITLPMPASPKEERPASRQPSADKQHMTAKCVAIGLWPSGLRFCNALARLKRARKTVAMLGISVSSHSIVRAPRSTRLSCPIVLFSTPRPSSWQGILHKLKKPWCIWVASEWCPAPSREWRALFFFQL